MLAKSCILLVVLLLSQAQGLTHEKMDQILTAIRLKIFTAGSRFNIEPALHLRGIFHDCTQGCDGSINLAEGANKGLSKYVKRLERAYQANPIFKDNLSKGDFAVLCATYASGIVLKNGAEGGTGNEAQFNVPEGQAIFQYGRPQHTAPFDADDNEGPFSTGLEDWETVFTTTKMCLKDQIGEDDLVALMGVHYLGRARQKNTGFAGRWRPCGVKNKLTNGLYKWITGRGKPNHMQVQTLASQNNAGSTNVQPDNLQWTRLKNNGQAGKGRILLNTDMAMYHKLNLKADGSGQVVDANLKYCSQGNNAGANVVECDTDPANPTTHMPLNGDRAQMTWQYATNQQNFHQNYINAFMKMVTTPVDAETLTAFAPEIKCFTDSEGVTRPKCMGDVYQQGCPGFTVPTC